MVSKRRRLTREIISDLKKSAQKMKLRAQVVLLDREMDQIRSAFGVSLFDLVDEQTEIPELEEAYAKCKEVVSAKSTEQTEKHTTMDAHQNQRLQAPQPTNVSERATWVKENVTTRSQDAKLKFQSLWLDREIKKAKETFGKDVCDVLIADALESFEDSESAPPEEPIPSLIALTAAKMVGPKKDKEGKLEEIKLLESLMSNNNINEEQAEGDGLEE